MVKKDVMTGDTGFSLLLVLMLLLLMSWMLAAAVRTAHTDLRMSQHDSARAQALEFAQWALQNEWRKLQGLRPLLWQRSDFAAPTSLRSPDRSYPNRQWLCACAEVKGMRVSLQSLVDTDGPAQPLSWRQYHEDASSCALTACEQAELAPDEAD